MTEKPPANQAERKRLAGRTAQKSKGGRQAGLRSQREHMSGRGWSGKKLSQGLFSSTLYPGSVLDSTERLEPSFLGVAALSLGFCRPGSESSWPSGGLSPSDTLPEELSWRAEGKNKGSLELRSTRG